MKKRTLRDDEKALWDQVARTTVPIFPGRKPPQLDLDVKLPLTTTSEPPASQADAPAARIPEFSIGSKAPTATRIPPSAGPAAPKMDAKAYRRLSRGKLDPEARIDLHGMTVDQAHSELIHFILRSHTKGRRLVLVITGKGTGPGPTGPLPYQRGILRRQVPVWLSQNPVAPLILETTPANIRHGGDGALYVYLRRRR
ncbi:MAG: Smr/MutS family protein [Pseudomonadota bacterium]